MISRLLCGLTAAFGIATAQASCVVDFQLISNTKHSLRAVVSISAEQEQLKNWQLSWASQSSSPITAVWGGYLKEQHQLVTIGSKPWQKHFQNEQPLKVGLEWAPTSDWQAPKSFQLNGEPCQHSVAINTPPVTHSENYRAAAGETVMDQLQSGDREGDAVRFEIVRQPQQGSVELDPLTGSFQYRAREGAKGLDQFYFVATDQTGRSQVTPITIELTSDVASYALR